MTNSKFKYTTRKYLNTYNSPYGPTSNLGNGVAADFNRDGRIDIVYGLDISRTDNPLATPVGVFANTGRGFRPFQLTIDGKKNQWPDVKFGMYTLAVDINGDRIPDIIPIDQSEAPGSRGTFEGNYQYAYISTGIGRYQKVQVGDDKYNVHGWGIIESVDKKFRILYNTPWTENYQGGDGVSTVISTYNTKTKKFDSEYYTGKSSYYSALPDQWKEFFYQATIDMNNDGNTDIVGFSSDRGRNIVYLNNGHGKFNAVKEISTGLGPQVKVEEITTGDFNGDGLKDMVVMGVDHSQNYNKTLRVLINKNARTFEDKTDQYLGGKFQNIGSSFGFLDSYDINRDGLTDFVWNHNTDVNHAGNWNFDVFVSNGNSFNVHTIENAVGARTIPLGNNSLFDGNNIITLSDSANRKAAVKKIPTWLPGELDDYVITKGKGYNIFTSDTEQYWIPTTKKNINFDDYAVLLNSQNNLVGLPMPIPSDFG